jgi:hypothetical protein
MATEDSALRAELVQLLKGKQAHADVSSALADFPIELAGERPHGLPYSAWQLLEHMRLALSDLLEFVTNSEYKAPKWPDDYWPKDPNPPSKDVWDQSVKVLHADLEAFINLAEDKNANLYDMIPWADDKQTLLREIFLAADHTSYHTGELIVLRRLLGIWS